MAVKIAKPESKVVYYPMLQEILEELRLLRSEVMLLFPQDDLEDYAHPARIQKSYQKAIKEYPPLASWK